MSLLVLFAVLGAAMLHATWNALVRGETNRVAAMMVLSGVQGVIGAVIALGHDWPTAGVLPWLIASGAIHSAYKIFLSFAYEHGDLGRVYPLARGTAPMITLVAGAILLAEPVSTTETAGILVLGVGILALSRGVWASGSSRRMLPFAFASALATAGYTIVDGLGARIAGDAGLFVAWMFLIDGLIFAMAMLLLRGRTALPTGRNIWIAGSLGAAASYGAYAIAVWAMTIAPIALVAALRETSILFAVLIGWAVFKEPVSRERALSVLLVVAGVVLTRL